MQGENARVPVLATPAPDRGPRKNHPCVSRVARAYERRSRAAALLLCGQADPGPLVKATARLSNNPSVRRRQVATVEQMGLGRAASRTPQTRIVAPQLELCLPKLNRLVRRRTSTGFRVSAGVLAAGPVPPCYSPQSRRGLNPAERRRVSVTPEENPDPLAYPPDRGQSEGAAPGRLPRDARIERYGVRVKKTSSSTVLSWPRVSPHTTSARPFGSVATHM